MQKKIIVYPVVLKVTCLISCVLFGQDQRMVLNQIEKDLAYIERKTETNFSEQILRIRRNIHVLKRHSCRKQPDFSTAFDQSLGRIYERSLSQLAECTDIVRDSACIHPIPMRRQLQERNNHHAIEPAVAENPPGMSLLSKVRSKPKIIDKLNAEIAEIEKGEHSEKVDLANKLEVELQQIEGERSEIDSKRNTLRRAFERNEITSEQFKHLSSILDSKAKAAQSLEDEGTRKEKTNEELALRVKNAEGLESRLNTADTREEIETILTDVRSSIERGEVDEKRGARIEEDVKLKMKNK